MNVVRDEFETNLPDSLIAGATLKSCDHMVGMIAGRMVRKSEWNVAVREFAKVVDDFNVRGQRVEVPHPGFIQPFTYCTECGGENDWVPLVSFGEALTAIEEAR